MAWPLDVASHWLDVAFACGRLGLDAALAKVGYLFVDDGASLTTMVDLCERPRPRFFEHDGKLAYADAEEIYRCIDLGDGSLPDPQAMPIASLDDDGKRAVEAFRSGTTCACPLCHFVVAEFGGSLPSAEDRWTIERACEWASNNTVAWTSAPDGSFVGWVSDYHDEPIVHFTRDLRARQSRDGGRDRRRSEPTVTPLRLAERRWRERALRVRGWRRVVEVARDAERRVVVAGTAFDAEGNSSATLVRSSDGGATWTDLFAGGDTDSHRSALAHPDGRIYWTPSQIGTLSVSADDGATWTKLFWDYQPQRMIVDPTRPGAVLAMSFNRCARIVPRD